MNRPHRLPAVFLRGMLMGAADVVPGVSGGTIAFITGIYERLIGALASFNGATVKQLLAGQYKSFWSAIDGSFLLVLFSGILLSVFSLASFIDAALNSVPHLVWSLFLGLVLASALYLVRKLTDHRFWQLVPLGAGLLTALAISLAPPLANPAASAWLLLPAGALGICAMVLPGISGSFILLLLGMYQPLLTAVKTFDLVSLGYFALGCVLGLLSFVHLLKWLLNRYHDTTITVLTGFLLGALPIKGG